MLARKDFIITIIFCLALPILYGQEGITIRLDPEKITADEAQNGREIEISIKIDVAVPTSGIFATGDPYFTVSFRNGSGELIRGNTDKAKWEHKLTFSVERTTDRTQAQGGAIVRFKPDENSRPATVEFTVEGALGVDLLQVSNNYTGPRYRSIANLQITQGGLTETPSAGEIRSPFKPTSKVINPGKKLLQQAAALAALMLVLSGANYFIQRRVRKLEQIIHKEPEKPGDPEFKEDNLKNSDAECTVLFIPEPRKIKGNNLDHIHFMIAAIPLPGWEAEIISVNPENNPEGYNEFSESDYISELSGLIEKPGADKIFRKTSVPWESDDQHDIIINASVKVKLRKGRKTKFVSRTVNSNERNWFKDDEPNITILGANIRIDIYPLKHELMATGRDPQTVDLAIKSVYMFYELVPYEEMDIVFINGRIGGQDWSYNAGKNWQPPFMINEHGKTEDIYLQASCRWIGGKLWRQAGEPNSLFHTGKCVVTLRPCSASLGEYTTDFYPISGYELLAKANIWDADGYGTNNPFSINSLKAEGAGIKCKVWDLSRTEPKTLKVPGIPGAPDLRLPPEQPLNAIIADIDNVRDTGELKKAIESKLSDKNLVAQPEVYVWEQGDLYTLDTRPDYRGIKLCSYGPNKNQDPFHGGLVYFSIEISDGLGGSVILSSACVAKLGCLTLETGGADFRIFEHTPYMFEIETELSKDQELTFNEADTFRYHWQFAVMDEGGNPVFNLGTIVSEEMSTYGKTQFILGHTSGFNPQTGSMTRDIFIDRETGEVKQDVPEEEPDPGRFHIGLWRKVEPVECKQSYNIRKNIHSAWYELSNTAASSGNSKYTEEALQYLSRDDSVKWRDRYLPLAVRVELRNQKNELLATSDRIVSEYMRTTADVCWRDHEFKYVLLALRLRLQDTNGEPYAERKYMFEINGSVSTDSNENKLPTTNKEGFIEEYLPPDSDTAELTIFHNDDITKDNDHSIFEVKLGYLYSPKTTEGAKARLNNLGLFASEKISYETDEKYKRAILRFQQKYELELTGHLNEETIDKLKEIHDTGYLDVDR